MRIGNLEYVTRPVRHNNINLFGVRTTFVSEGLLYFEVSHKNGISYPNIKCDMEWVTWPYEYEKTKILETFLDNGVGSDSERFWVKDQRTARNLSRGLGKELDR